jgi:chromosome segregation ATPase
MSDKFTDEDIKAVFSGEYDHLACGELIAELTSLTIGVRWKVDELEAKNATQQATITDLENERDTYRATYITDNTLIAKLQTKINNYKTQITNQIAVISSLQATITDLGNERDTYEATCMANDILIAQRDATIAELTKAITDFREGNYSGLRALRDCPHGTHYWQECANCDEEYWQAALKEKSDE